MRNQLIQAIQEAEPGYLFAYWSELDAIGHPDGITSERAATHLLELDRAFSEIAEQARMHDVLLLMTADHVRKKEHLLM